MKSFAAVFGIFVILAIAITFLSSAMGIGGFGPTEVIEATILKTYVDVSGGGKDSETETHYVVVTDKGSFEVDNGILLGMWNADDVFGKLQTNKKYRLTTKGKRYQNWLMQEFPYIIKADTL